MNLVRILTVSFLFLGTLNVWGAKTLSVRKFSVAETVYNGNFQSISYYQISGNPNYSAQLVIAGVPVAGQSLSICWIFLKDRSEALNLYKFIRETENLSINCENDMAYPNWIAVSVNPDTDNVKQRFYLR